MASLHVLDAKKRPIELEVLHDGDVPAAAAPPVMPTGVTAASDPVVRATRGMFMDPQERRAGRAPRGRVAVLREVSTGLLRTVHHEIVVRFAKRATAAQRKALLAKHGLVLRKRNAWIPTQLVVHDPEGRIEGADLLPVAVKLAETEEVVFATPNFVSEFRRSAAAPKVRKEQWHLVSADADHVNVLEAWRVTRGDPKVVVAVLDDGVDLEHPDLKRAMWSSGTGAAKDVGRDFFVPDDHPEHGNPRPKLFRFPFDVMTGNDIHGTPCAGVIAARGPDAWGVAPRCRVLAVKIFHADDLAVDARVADAIRYAATNADILSCSWSGPRSPDIELAIEDAGRLGRNGKGSAVFCAAGNDGDVPAGFPAAFDAAIAVAASTDGGKRAPYSQTGDALDLCAPSSGGVRGIFTTDVSLDNRGFNVGRAAAGGADGLYTNSFGGTSSATPLAAGIGALALSVHPDLDRDALREHLRRSCVRIDAAGGQYDAGGHSRFYGYGRLDALKAVQ
jgi:subtilisin family serine protease